MSSSATVLLYSIFCLHAAGRSHRHRRLHRQALTPPETFVTGDSCRAKSDPCRHVVSCTPAGLQVNDVSKAAGVVADMRKVFRQDTRIIQKLHRRVFIDKITPEQVPDSSVCCVEIIIWQRSSRCPRPVVARHCSHVWSGVTEHAASR